MNPKTTRTAASLSRYSNVAIAFHWTIAAVLILQVFIGWRLEDLEPAARSLFLQLHRTVGVAILLLTLGRLAWRLTNPPPPQHDQMKPIEHKLAHLVHVAFYGLMLGLPLTGWAMASMERAGSLKLLGALKWPAFPLVSALPGDLQDSLAGVFDNLHSALVWVMLALLALHVAAALKHHFITRDPTISRMAPGVKPGSLDARLAIIPAAAAGLAFMAYAPTPHEPPPRPAPKSFAQADAYLDIVGPALDRRCASCHSDDSSRGGFSLDSYDALMRGGHGGAVVKPGDAKDSTLFQRVNLPASDKKYMPQGDHPALSANQIAAMKAWIDAGAPQGPIAQLKLTDEQKAALQKAMPVAEGADDDGLPTPNGIAPLPTVAAADGTVVAKLEAQSFLVRRVSANSNLVDVNYNGFNAVTDAQIADLAKIGPQILYLNLRGGGVTDSQLKTIAGFTNLRRLRLQDDPVTDAGVAQLAGLGKLETLNLVSTKISDASLATLERMTGLNRVFLWNTGVSAPAIERYKAQNTKVAVVPGLKEGDVTKETLVMQPAN